MRKLYFSALGLILPITMNAQVIRGDMDGNGQLTIADVTLLVGTVTGCKPAQPITVDELASNDKLAGIWYLTKTETVAFLADGTTNYAGATNYKFFPDLNYIILTNAAGYAKGILNVTALDEKTLCINGETIYTKTPPAALVASIALNVTDLQLYVGEAQQIEANVLPADADDKSLIWESSDPKVATVAGGLVTAVAEGKATITCTAADGSGVVTSCAVTVTPQGNPGTQVPEGSGA